MNIDVGRRVVTVGVDGSECALRAVRWGAAEAARRGAALRLVTAFGWLPERTDGPSFRLDYREMLRGRAESQLAAARVAARRVAPSTEVEAEVILGSPHAVLGAEARIAQLLVVGSRGRGRLEELIAGSVGVALAASAPCPVVVVRGEERDPDEEAQLPIAVGVDGTAGGDEAIAFAFDAAASRQVELVAVHAWNDITAPFGYAPFEEPVISEEELQALAERLAGHLAGWARKHPDVPVRRVLARGRPAPCLLEQAQQAQLVVVGSRGRGEFAGLVLGSVGNVLVHHAPCPVAVVRP
ncbi:nucleotide-binding universal stress UspA family protein [Pseudonocardia hierapolitana]|uniref:Nucleotide-binding universal stress UspA family protein n=1 Tax=Pseudonocardia hierapolitana TaxID=1128676 RepID=A0A561SJW8_9PSEU|nr:universal stress protein [Pseudonocardia hierapolitana]TWF75151.1 nucleotide-binding universal stress UspA family protein [Pseudonocardia hierapolitana]